MLLHEMTDLCDKSNTPSNRTSITNKHIKGKFEKSRTYINTKAIGTVGFPSPATYHTKYDNPFINMNFSDGNKNFEDTI